MKYSSALVKSWNQPYFDKEPAMAHGFPSVLWGVVTESGANMFNVLPDSEIALIYEAGNWLFIGKTFSQKEIADAFTTGKFSAESVAAYVLVEDLLGWTQEANLNEWGATALMKLYGICHEHGTSEVLYALISMSVYSKLFCIQMGIKSIASSIDVNDADYGTTRWVSKVIRYTFTSQF